ncbi:MAG: hypothetical protein QCH35_05580 [Methanomicrobiaceae archaeon]|nr:hypothetical protein [Methanomicrobiaceae archaeon]
MISKAILEDEETFMLILQLTDMATAAHERGDYEKRDHYLDEIRQLRERITRVNREESAGEEQGHGNPEE